MFGYATNLRSRTQGRGQFTMEPSHYIELNKNLTDAVVSKRKAYNRANPCFSSCQITFCRV
ncbi:MAG: hypothetical protein ACLR8L_00425 [Oscillospiraceae bacterium]